MRSCPQYVRLRVGDAQGVHGTGVCDSVHLMSTVRMMVIRISFAPRGFTSAHGLRACWTHARRAALGGADLHHPHPTGRTALLSRGAARDHTQSSLGPRGALHPARSRIGYAHTDSLLTYPHRRNLSTCARQPRSAHPSSRGLTSVIGTPAGQLLNCTPEPERPYRATRWPTRSTTRWAFGGIHNPTMKQPPSMLIFPHQQAEKSPQNQHVLSFNPRFVV